MLLLPLKISGRLKFNDFFALVLSTLIIAAAGNIINNNLDIKADCVNRPERILIELH